MRKVERLDEPDSLRTNKQVWKKELLRCLNDPNCAKSKKVKSLKKRYDKKDVRERLGQMYKGYCCYCESNISTVTTEHIEHRKPQSRFPEETFEWENLHLACPDCNGYKSDKYNSSYPILDACKDDPDDHLSYAFVYRKALTRRGQTTLDHTKLDRSELVDVRTRVYERVERIIEKIKDNPNDPGNASDLRFLEREFEGHYGSLVRTMVRRAFTQVITCS